MAEPWKLFIKPVLKETFEKQEKVKEVTFPNQTKQENAMRCNNRDDLLKLSFTLEISVYSEAYI